MARILLVDDEDVILSIVGSLLETDGHDIHKALGGDIAMTMMTQSDYELMISDIRMNPVNGISLLEYAVKKKPAMKNIILTAMRSDSTKQKVLAMGAKAFITKPFMPAMFLAVVKETLEQPQAE